MPRPKGSRVIICECGGRVVGMPRRKVKCKYCNKKHTMPRSKKK